MQISLEQLITQTLGADTTQVVQEFAASEGLNFEDIFQTKLSQSELVKLISSDNTESLKNIDKGITLFNKDTEGSSKFNADTIAQLIDSLPQLGKFTKVDVSEILRQETPVLELSTFGLDNKENRPDNQSSLCSIDINMQSAMPVLNCLQPNTTPSLNIMTTRVSDNLTRLYTSVQDIEVKYNTPQTSLMPKQATIEWSMGGDKWSIQIKTVPGTDRVELNMPSIQRNAGTEPSTYVQSVQKSFVEFIQNNNNPHVVFNIVADKTSKYEASLTTPTSEPRDQSMAQQHSGQQHQQKHKQKKN